jgi:hypothetical protein
MINLRSLADDPRLKSEVVRLDGNCFRVISAKAPLFAPADDQHRQGKFSKKDYQT